MAGFESFAGIAPYLAHPLVLVGFGVLLVFAVHRSLIKSGIIPPLEPRTGGRVVQTLLRYGFIIAALLILLGFGLEFFRSSQSFQVDSRSRNDGYP
jgi:hypothetical protein